MPGRLDVLFVQPPVQLHTGSIFMMSGIGMLAPTPKAVAAFALGLLGSSLVLASEVEPASLADCDRDDVARTLHPASLTPAHSQAIWLDDRHLRWPQQSATEGRYRLYASARAALRLDDDGGLAGSDRIIELDLVDGDDDSGRASHPHVRGGVLLALPENERERLPELLRGQVLIGRDDSNGRVGELTGSQIAAALDARYARAAGSADLGARPGAGGTAFALWAPTAHTVAVCLYPDDRARADAVRPLSRAAESGVWSLRDEQDLTGHHFTYLVDVVVPGVGLVRNRVTDPYALSLGADSRRGYVIDLDHPSVTPEGWAARPRPAAAAAAVDQVIYELHVRDFSITDSRVPAADRGNYLGFTHSRSHGMRHLRALAEAGLSDVHLLPVFDIATIPESGCVTPQIEGAADSERQQAIMAEYKDRDCFNWGYDPFHYTAPEGSYASDAGDGSVRVREFRRMVMALNAIGLRVGMDVVYNHTSAAGQDRRSVLDRIVPGYYQRLDADGAVETSTCCPNTATEHAMMAKLMIDSAVVWARDYGIDAFRFDLMGHQPLAAMLQLQAAVDAAAGRRIHLLGEGWNFGEVADGARFVQAAQLQLAGSGIASFNDRARDAARGGGCCDTDAEQVIAQGWLNGLHYAPNELALAAGRDQREALMRQADLIRAGLTGSLRDYRLVSWTGEERTLAQIDYEGQPAGYVAEPGEVVNYVENHDNPTLFDINVLKLPVATSREDRARVQVLGLAVVALSQGIAYFHAGGEILRSKSLDRNSYDSGDWFNRIDWTLRDNHFGIGLPPAWDNEASWPWMRPRLGNPEIRPQPAEIRWTRDAFLDLLRIRASSRLFRMRSAQDVRQRLRLLNTGPDQEPAVLAGMLDGDGYRDANYAAIAYFLNADVQAHTLVLPELAGRDWRLHPVQRSRAAADSRPRREARIAAGDGIVTVPARSVVVYVVR